MIGLGELLNDCLGIVLSIGLLLIVASCMAPIGAALGATGRRKRRRSRKIGPREAICLILVVMLLALSLADGTMEAMISSFIGK